MRNIEDQFIIKSKIYFNQQSIQLLAGIKGTKAFVVSDGIMEKLGYLKQTVDYLQQAGMSSDVFTDIKPDPDTKIVAAGMQAFMKSGADVIVALGGGSAIDAAKGMLYAAWQYAKVSEIPFERPYFIAIPSTSGTGSEVTNFSVITAEGDKVCIVDEYIAPDMAILDSTCIQHVPQPVVADTGIDVLVHALEAYVSLKATDFTDALAEKAVQLIFEYLPALYNDVANSKARDHVQNASCMAGMAFTNSNLGINHSLAHALGATFHLPHGRSNALMMIPVIEYNAHLKGDAGSYAAKRYAKLAAQLGLPARTPREGVVSLVCEIKALKQKLGIQSSIREAGIDSAEFEVAIVQMAETAMLDRCTPTNPRTPMAPELVEIYRQAF